jgi:predicted DNA binding CopG/RHH family protein
MARKAELNEDVRINIDLPPALRRKLARMSVERDIDLQSFIRQILERECTQPGIGF